ncbi:hypothetical protein CAPTEDRAFT_182898 [Capitella teleta]|uniref:Ubiquitin-like protein ATG12 n=1 Tax=Capitella teleta TaxID=283909 RepID=R7TEM3_CAPTE|nr:hypothetical protein CAPTEDRAFT_182898 [Capitella teleta]|eukprot:ELT92179.1 hypothetical protein CAPTEDRAFT_182898 [Capitella teleta]
MSESSHTSAAEGEHSGGGHGDSESVGSNSSSNTSSPAIQAKSKVDILLKATGDAPIIKQKKWTVDRSKKIGYVAVFVKKLLKIKPQESLFFYVSQSFAPALDTELGTIYDNFGADGKLILHYCKTQAWG